MLEFLTYIYPCQNHSWVGVSFWSNDTIKNSHVKFNSTKKPKLFQDQGKFLWVLWHEFLFSKYSLQMFIAVRNIITNNIMKWSKILTILKSTTKTKKLQFRFYLFCMLWYSWHISLSKIFQVYDCISLSFLSHGNEYIGVWATLWSQHA